MQKIKIAFAALIVTAVGVLSTVALASPVSAVSCPTGSIREGENVKTLAECNVAKDEEGQGLMETVQVIINVALSVLGIVAVVMIIMGGVQYTTSSGDPAKAQKARNTIMYGVIGLVIALLAFAIVNFVLSNIWGDDRPDASGGGSDSEKSSYILVEG